MSGGPQASQRSYDLEWLDTGVCPRMSPYVSICPRMSQAILAQAILAQASLAQAILTQAILAQASLVQPILSLWSAPLRDSQRILAQKLAAHY